MDKGWNNPGSSWWRYRKIIAWYTHSQRFSKSQGHPPTKTPGSSAVTNGRGKANCLLMTNGYLSNSHINLHTYRRLENRTPENLPKIMETVHVEELPFLGKHHWKWLKTKVSWKKWYNMIFDPRQCCQHEKWFWHIQSRDCWLKTSNLLPHPNRWFKIIHVKNHSLEWTIHLGVNISNQQTCKYH